MLRKSLSLRFIEIFMKNCCYQNFKSNPKNFSQYLTKKKTSEKFKMRAWQVHSYGEDVLLSSIRVPIIQDLNEVLIKVEAASVNPIDLYMRDGYAKTSLDILRRCEMELPLTLGRDFCGTIVGQSLSSSKSFQLGDKVYGFIPLHKQGSFSEYTIAKDSHIQLHPEYLKTTESSSLVYATMTAWSALFITGGLQFENRRNKHVLILGASGGVGTTAVQLLKSQGVFVTGTCSTDAIPLVKSLGADEVLDYTHPDYIQQIGEQKFDIILDCAKFGSENLPTNWKFKQFITLNSPLMSDTDQNGLIGGLIKSGSNLLKENILMLKDGKIMKWAFFIPSQRGFKFIDDLIKSKEITPVLHREYLFPELSNALKEVKQGHLRGKVVIKFD